MSSSLKFERCFYVGNILGAIIYGVQIYIAINSIRLLARSSRTFYSKFLVGYVILMTICMTVAIAATAFAGQAMWIDHRDFPGGPFAYHRSTSSNWFNALGTACVMFANFMGDGLLSYRCFKLWDSNIGMIAVPFVIYVASTASAIITCIESYAPQLLKFLVYREINFALPWISLTSGLNVILTFLIVSRLMQFRRQADNIGEFNLDSTNPNVYTNAIAIVVESALPFSILGVLYAVCFGKGNAVYVVISVIWASLAGLSPMLIILRISTGSSWSTASQLVTSLDFAPDSCDQISTRSQAYTQDVELGHVSGIGKAGSLFPVRKVLHPK